MHGKKFHLPKILQIASKWCVQFHFYAYSPSTHMGQLFSAFFLSSREHLETWEIEIYTGSKT